MLRACLLDTIVSASMQITSLWKAFTWVVYRLARTFLNVTWKSPFSTVSFNDGSKEL